ncbi:MAG: PHB depolymerase family esterase [Deferribacterota bacterium]|nr:PHB depolymerase family esterase [Deferribacterota bacterium]
MNSKKIVLPTLQLAVIAFLLVLVCFNSINALSNQVGDHTGSITWEGLERTYLVHIPPSYGKNKSMPLLIALHGGGGTSKSMVNITEGGLNTLADKEGFIVVYPDGFDKHWNDGRSREETRYKTQEENIDDVGFISTLISYFIKELNIDSKRVYVTGMSNGAMMSYRLACELAEKIAAVAPVAGNMPQNLSLTCSPSKPISVLAINNVNDPLMPLEGGDVTLPFGSIKLGKVLSVSEMVMFWVNHNHCSSQPLISYEPDKDPQDGTRVKKEVYDRCKDGTEVILYAIEGGGHTWPDGWQYLPERVVGKTSKDIDANEVIWNFFKKHMR